MKKNKKTTSDISEKESSEHVISKENAEELLKVMLDGIEEALIKGESVKIDKIGTFTLQKKEPEIIIEEKKPEEKTPDREIPVEEIPEILNQPEIEHIPLKQKREKKPKLSFEENLKPLKNFRIKRGTILFFVIIFVPLIMILYFFSPGFHKTFNKIFLGQDTELSRMDYFESESDMSLVKAYMDSIRNDSILREEQNNLIIENVRLYAEMLTEFTTESEMTLEQLSKEYYGDEIFWVYIYDANKDNLTGLRRVKKGTLISIPKIPEDLLDINNLKSSDIAYKMMDIILKEKDQKRSTKKVVEEPEKPELAKVTSKIPGKIPEKKPEKVPEKKSEISPVKSAPVAPKTTEKTAIAPKTTISTPTVPKTTISAPVAQLATENKLSKTPAVVVLAEGERLTMYSLKYYGHKDFWVYIYEANSDVISNPDDIPVGTTIQIPKLGSDKIDASNPECLRKARLLHNKYVKRAR